MPTARYLLVLATALLLGCTSKAQPPTKPPVVIAPKPATTPPATTPPKTLSPKTNKPFSTWVGSYALQVMGLLGTPLPEGQLVVEAVAGKPYYAVSRNIGGGKSPGWGLAQGHLLTVAHGNNGEVGVAQLLPAGKDLLGTYRDAYGRMGTLRIINALAAQPNAPDARPTGTFDIWIQMEPQQGTDYIMEFGGTVKITHQDAITTFLFWPDAEEDYYIYGVGFASGGVWHLAVCSDPGPLPMAIGPDMHRLNPLTPDQQQPPGSYEQVRNPMQPYTTVGFGVSVYTYKTDGKTTSYSGQWAPYGHNELMPESLVR